MKFLIIKLSSLGDVIHTLPIVYKLRQNYPHAQIDWLVGEKGYELLSLISEINNVYLLNLKNVFLIQKQNYDYVIDAQGLFKSAFLSRLSFGKTIIGFKNTREFGDLFYNKKINAGNLFKTDNHIVDLNLKLISDLTSDNNGVTKFLIPKILKPHNEYILQVTSNKNRKIVLFPSTTWESKLWNMDYWFELISKISNDFQIYVCASKSDLYFIKPLIDKLDSEEINYINLVGKTKIRDLIYLIQNVDLVIGLDSAGLHLTSAIKNDFGFPNVVGIFGPTSPKRSGPYGSIEKTLCLSDMECIACRKKQCPLGHHKCMKDISSFDVMKKVSLLFLNR